jgi:histidyl-tRNA synthetase
VEYLNVVSPVADAEVIELGYRYLEAVGVSHLELLVNSLGDGNCRPAYVSVLRGYLEARQEDLSPDSVRLIEVNPLRVLDSKVDAGKLDDPPRMIDFLCADCADHYQGVKTLLDRLDIPYTEDDTLVRGLDYYTRTAFEYIARGLETAQNAVGGGGRYDGLAETLGGPATPGVGFALGLDRIVLSTGKEPPTHLDAYLVSETDAAEAIGVVSMLRRQGLRVDFDGEGRSVKAQFRTASRLGVPVVLIYSGDDQSIGVQTADTRAEMPVGAVAGWIEGRDDA